MASPPATGRGRQGWRQSAARRILSGCPGAAGHPQLWNTPRSPPDTATPHKVFIHEAASNAGTCWNLLEPPRHFQGAAVGGCAGGRVPEQRGLQSAPAGTANPCCTLPESRNPKFSEQGLLPSAGTSRLTASMSTNPTRL